MSATLAESDVDVYVFDDRISDAWVPFALSRPGSELRFGRWLLRERLERFADTPVAGLLTRSWLRAFHEGSAPPVVSLDEIPSDRTRVFLSARFVPELSARVPGSSSNLWADGHAVGCRLPPGDENPDASWLAEPTPLPGLPDEEIPGRVLGHMWDFIARHVERLALDLVDSTAGGAEPELPHGVERLGDHPVRLGPGVRLEPGVLLDARAAPIELDANVEVRAGARLGGPLYAGPDCRLLGGAIEALSAGPVCYLRGEIEESTVLGYSNKAHDGFLGHAYLGRWVNLGALTTNSDLKNNYGPVRLGPPGHEVDTGLLKLGCLIGDHAKTGIGLMLGTGTVLGAGCNVFGTDMPPKWTPPFSWGSGSELSVYRKDAFEDVAALVMERRGVEVDDRTRAWLAAVWETACG
jgi:UDP-N-acetylglucosamine diphosphorylase/glucosamine-1-phosphate N-acetyltransferase